MTVVTDLAFPKFTSPGNYLVPNPSSNPAFTSTGSPINGGLGNLTFAYNDVTLQVPCLTLQNYLTLLCRNDLDDSVLVNRWGIFFRTLNATAVSPVPACCSYQPVLITELSQRTQACQIVGTCGLGVGLHNARCTLCQRS
jgi:hypothetical protein